MKALRWVRSSFTRSSGRPAKPSQALMAESLALLVRPPPPSAVGDPHLLGGGLPLQDGGPAGQVPQVLVHGGGGFVVVDQRIPKPLDFL